jgi:hypothetical protein
MRTRGRKEEKIASQKKKTDKKGKKCIKKTKSTKIKGRKGKN